MNHEDESSGAGSNGQRDNVRKLSSLSNKKTKTEEPKAILSVEPEEDDDLTRELLELYQIPIRRRKPEGI